MSKLKASMKVILLSLGLSLNPANASAGETRTGSGEGENPTEQVISQEDAEILLQSHGISEDQKAAILQDAIAEYKEKSANGEDFENKDLIKDMVVEGTMDVKDLTIDDLIAMQQGLSPEEISKVGNKLKNEFLGRYGRGELNEEQIRSSFMSGVMMQSELKAADIATIVSMPDADKLLDERTRSNLTFRYVNYYDMKMKGNPQAISDEDLVTILNSPIGKNVLDSDRGIKIPVEQAKRLLVNYDQQMDPRVDLEKLGMSREQFLAYALDKNIDNLDQKDVIALMASREEVEGLDQIGHAQLIDGQPLALKDVLDNMQHSDKLCSQALDYALDYTHLNIDNSSQIAQTGSEYEHARIIRNVLDYSLLNTPEHPNQNSVDKEGHPHGHIDNYMRIVDYGGKCLESGLDKSQENYHDRQMAGIFIHDEVVARAGNIDQKSNLFLAMPSFVRPEGWEYAVDQKQKLNSAKAVMGAVHMLFNKGEPRMVFSGPGSSEKVPDDYSSIDQTAMKERRDIFNMYFYMLKENEGKTLTEAEKRHIEEMNKKYSQPPYSPTFLDDMFSYAVAVHSGDQARIEAAARNVEKNNGIRLPENVEGANFSSRYDKVMGYDNLGDIDENNRTIEGQKDYIDLRIKERTELYLKGTEKKPYELAGLRVERDFAYEGYFNAGVSNIIEKAENIDPNIYVDMINNKRFRNNREARGGWGKLAADFGKYYEANKDKEGTSDVVAKVLNTDKGNLFLQTMGANITQEDFAKLEEMGILNGKSEAFLTAYNNAKSESKRLAEARGGHTGAETAQINTDALREAFQTSMEGDALTAAFASVMTGNNDELSAAFASAMAQERQEGYTQQDVDRHMEEVRGKARHTPPRGSTFDATKLFIKDKTYS